MRPVAKALVLAGIPPIRRMYAQLQELKAALVPYQMGGVTSPDGQPEYGSFRPRRTFAAAVGVSPGVAADDTALLRRICAAYKRTNASDLPRGTSVWREIEETHHGKLRRALLSDDIEAAGAILRDPASSSIFWGIDNLFADVLARMQQPEQKAAHAKVCLGGLIRVAEAMGLVPVCNPEFPNANRDEPFTADDVIARIEQYLGVTIDFANPFPNEPGAMTCRGVVSYRAPQALYQAWRVQELVKGVKSPRILEIGGGLGRTAHLAKMLGQLDYTIVDLPSTSVYQAYFLGRVLGGESICLFGEQASNSKTQIKLLTPSAFLESDEPYSLVLNVDSLTEMDPTVARDYCRRIKSVTSRFLSINHEANSFTVFGIIQGFRQPYRLERYPYWMRPGYTEELVTFGEGTQ